jgi:hypothetical protein
VRSNNLAGLLGNTSSAIAKMISSTVVALSSSSSIGFGPVDYAI